MSLFYLSCVWIVLGLMLGLLTVIAAWQPQEWRTQRGLLSTLGCGALFALLGGWLGIFLMGSFYATLMALWIGIVCTTLFPFLVKAVARTRSMA